jgi:predicted aspartyl protease
VFADLSRIVVETILENALDPSHTICCRALVDTGAGGSYLTLPKAWRDRLGMLTELDTVAGEMANQA